MRDKTRSGRCDCGALRYEVHGDLGDVSLCHCHQCRRIHGNPAAFTRTERANLRILEDQGLKWYRSSDSGERGFCRECGSSLFARFEGDPLIDISPGSLDDDGGLKTMGHIFVAHRGRSYEITDDLPQADDYD